MAGHWRFLELSLPTADIAASAEFYLRLGFTELTTTDARSYPYVVFSDGRIAIGLHGEPLPGPSLSFVQPNVANWARQLAAAGFELENQRLGPDDFHEFTLAGPAGQRVTVREAAGFSPLQVQAAPPPLTGPSAHIEVRCGDLDEGADFWRIAGLEPGNEVADEASPEALELAAPALRLRLAKGAPTAPRLHFPAPAHAELEAAATRFGLTLKRQSEYWEIAAPEATVLELHAPGQ